MIKKKMINNLLILILIISSGINIVNSYSSYLEINLIKIQTFEFEQQFLPKEQIVFDFFSDRTFDGEILDNFLIESEDSLYERDDFIQLMVFLYTEDEPTASYLNISLNDHYANEFFIGFWYYSMTHGEIRTSTNKFKECVPENCTFTISSSSLLNRSCTVKGIAECWEYRPEAYSFTGNSYSYGIIMIFSGLLFVFVLKTRRKNNHE